RGPESFVPAAEASEPGRRCCATRPVHVVDTREQPRVLDARDRCVLAVRLDATDLAVCHPRTDARPRARPELDRRRRKLRHMKPDVEHREAATVARIGAL